MKLRVKPFVVSLSNHEGLNFNLMAIEIYVSLSRRVF